MGSPFNTALSRSESAGVSDVFSYSAFGATFACSFELPELVPSSTDLPPSWRIETNNTAAPVCHGELLGVDTVYGTVQVRAFASPDVLRLVFDDTGTFDVRCADRLIVWYPGPSPNEVAVRADLLGRVIALAAHADGALALHASAVSVGDAAIAFLGQKHVGKSTLAMSLVQQGARLLTDDTLVVRFDADGRPWAAPGVQRVRLWNDSARALGTESRGSVGAKPVVDQLPERCLAAVEVPLVGCYVLQSAERQETPVVRDELSSIRAAIACVSFSKLGTLAGGVASAAILDRATMLAKGAPVYAARVSRDLDRIAETAAAFMAWHTVGAVSAEAAS